ncbi:hypothetical protein GCM10009712_41590 [Pseudarthrobacter sulfonivorans]|uniref:hypothetical protein n=1 Tax=Pseudarthrobacter sulfonivorans TaxID=121292 RepID=UPI00168AE7D5|nr:hypothetical protein [Pseudarthrobacter sulfonivorans]
MLSLQDIDNIVLNGGVVVDVAGEKIGSVEQIFTSGDSGEPVFVTVRTGLFGMSESFAPLSGASLEESVIRVAFAKDTVKNGPRIDSDRGAITETQEQELYSYYGLYPGASEEGSATGAGRDEAPAAAGETVPQTTAAAAANDGRNDGGEWPAGPPHPLPHGGPPPPHPLPHGGPPPVPPHLHSHVPPHPHPGPGPHH